MLEKGVPRRVAEDAVGELLRLRKDCRGNLMVLEHMAGGSVGINIFLDRLRRRHVHCDTIGVIR